MTQQPLTSEQIEPDLATFQQARSDAQLARWVRNQYDSMKAARSKASTQWNLNLAFYKGRQYLELDRVYSGQLRVPKAPPHRVRQTINRIRPMVRTELSRITQQKPNASVVPATAEDEDLAAAYAAEQVWESLCRVNGADSEFRVAGWWMLICGTSFLKTWWDPKAGPTKQLPVDPFDPMAGMKEIPLGDVKFSAVTPYHLFVPDLRTIKVQDQPWVLNVYTRSADWVRNFYGDKLNGVNINNDVIADNEIISDSVLGLNGARKEPDAVLCMEMWIKPGGCNLLPEGGLVHVIGDTVVYAARDGIPYAHKKYPFTKLEHIPSGTFYADSSIIDLIPLQKEYNRTRSQITEAKNRTAKPQWSAAKGSIDVTKWTNEPGQVVEYLPGFQPPMPIPLNPLPNYVIEEQDRILSDFEDISGQHQVSKGAAPPGVTAATAISFLQEKDDGILSHTYDSVEKAWEDIAHSTLNLVVQYWDTERTIRTVGADGAFDTQLLKGADLKDSTDIRMEGGSALPVSKAARQAFIMDMMKMGFIPPQDGLKLLDIGGVQKLWENLRRDESQAQRENIKLKRADINLLAQFQDAQKEATQQFMEMAQQQQAQQPPQADFATGEMLPPDMPEPPPMESILPVNSWDNHEVHVMVHNNFRKSQEFELLDPAIKAEYEAHVNMHLAAINQAMQQAMEAQQMQDPSMAGGDEGPQDIPRNPGAADDSPPEEGQPA